MSTPTRPPNVRTRSSPRADATSRWVAVGFIALALIPLPAGSARLVVALTALWMTQLYARPEHTGVLLCLFRLAFGAGMAACLVLGFAAIRQRDVAGHRAWRLRHLPMPIAGPS